MVKEKTQNRHIAVWNAPRLKLLTISLLLSIATIKNVNSDIAKYKGNNEAIHFSITTWPDIPQVLTVGMYILFQSLV